MHIHQDNIRRRGAASLMSLGAVCGLADDFETIGFLQQGAYSLSEEKLVVNEQNTKVSH
jgi:hypothetical protein